MADIFQFQYLWKVMIMDAILTKHTQKQPQEVLKKSTLKNSQNSQHITCARVSFLIKLQARGPQLY